MGDWRSLAARAGRLYAEKAMMVQDGQRTPHHFHVVKTEDILNRGGARFVVELFKVDSRAPGSTNACRRSKTSRFSIWRPARACRWSPARA